MGARNLSSIFVLCLVFSAVYSENKYSKSANIKKEPDVDFRKLDKPFRMAKLNLLWTKAQHRLTQPKLASLYSDLMILDKEELVHKRLKSTGGDKEGLQEAKLRQKLIGLMTNYGLLEHFEAVQGSSKKVKQHEPYNESIDDHINRSLFKDKKLAQLWTKAETSGFTPEELAALKEEFNHHQDKIDQYYSLLRGTEEKRDDSENAVNNEDLDKYNELEDKIESNDIKKGYQSEENRIRDKHRDVRDNFDRLQRITAKGPDNKEFVEPKVQGLWMMAVSSNFTVNELHSLKTELKHYESRLLKLRHLHADHVSNLKKHAKMAASGDKMDHFDEAQQIIKKHQLKVDKLHQHLENRILERHSEL